jgi:hypothetical protein
LHQQKEGCPVSKPAFLSNPGAFEAENAIAALTAYRAKADSRDLSQEQSKDSLKFERNKSAGVPLGKSDRHSIL